MMDRTTTHLWHVMVELTPHWLMPFLPGEPVSIRLDGGIAKGGFNEDGPTQDLQDAADVEIQAAVRGATLVLGFSDSVKQLLIAVGAWGHLQVTLEAKSDTGSLFSRE